MQRTRTVTIFQLLSKLMPFVNVIFPAVKELPWYFFSIKWHLFCYKGLCGGMQHFCDISSLNWSKWFAVWKVFQLKKVWWRVKANTKDWEKVTATVKLERILYKGLGESYCYSQTWEDPIQRTGRKLLLQSNLRGSYTKDWEKVTATVKLERILYKGLGESYCYSQTWEDPIQRTGRKLLLQSNLRGSYTKDWEKVTATVKLERILYKGLGESYCYSQTWEDPIQRTGRKLLLQSNLRGSYTKDWEKVTATVKLERILYKGLGESYCYSQTWEDPIQRTGRKLLLQSNLRGSYTKDWEKVTATVKLERILYKGLGESYCYSQTWEDPIQRTGRKLLLQSNLRGSYTKDWEKVTATVKLERILYKGLGESYCYSQTWEDPIQRTGRKLLLQSNLRGSYTKDWEKVTATVKLERILSSNQLEIYTKLLTRW